GVAEGDLPVVDAGALQVAERPGAAVVVRPAQVDDGAHTQIVAEAGDAPRAQAVQFAGAKQSPPAHRAAIPGPIAADVAEVEDAGQLDPALHKVNSRRSA